MYRNMVANPPKGKGKKKAAKKKGKGKKAAKKKAAKKKAPKKAAKKKPPKVSKAKRKAAAKKAAATKAAKKKHREYLQAKGAGIGATIAAQQAKAAKAEKRKKAAKKAAKKRAIGVELADLRKIGKGLSSSDFDLLNAARMKGVGEAALRKLAKRLRKAAKAGAKPAAPKKAKKAKAKAKAKAAPAGRRAMPGSERVSARTASSRRKAAKKDGCTPAAEAVRCEDRPTLASLAACAQATRKHNVEREARGEPKKRARTVCGPGAKGRKGVSAKLLAHRKAAKPKGGLDPRKAAAIKRAFMRG